MTARPGDSKILDSIRSKKVAEEYRIREMAEKIKAIKESATELKQISGGIQAIDKNVDRILACVRMLEIDISDVVDIVSK
jgi:hypothetical protein